MSMAIDKAPLEIRLDITGKYKKKFKDKGNIAGGLLCSLLQCLRRFQAERIFFLLDNIIFHWSILIRPTKKNNIGSGYRLVPTFQILCFEIQ